MFKGWIEMNKKKVKQFVEFLKFKIIGQRTFCYCPKCDNELCKDSFCSDVDGLVTYVCSQCSEIVVFNFDIAPVPILIKPSEV
jgi:hypothetical protein